MNFKDFYIINEAPIETFKTLSKDKKGNVSDDPEKFASTNSSFSKKDNVSKKILTTPAAVHKIKNQFKNTEVDFDMYFYNGKEGIKNKELGEKDLKFIKDELGLNITPNPNNITIIFTNNTGDNKVMMTGWILAHRFGHAVRINGKGSKAWNEMIEECVHSFRNMFTECYQTDKIELSSSGTVYRYDYYKGEELLLKNFYTLIGTFKSARDNTLRSPYEFYYELFAQFLITGKIKFNNIPQKVPFKDMNGNKSWISVHDEELIELGNQYLNDLAEYNFPGRANNVLYAAQGKIFVM